MAAKKKAGRKKAAAKKKATPVDPPPRVRTRRGSSVGGVKVKQPDGSIHILDPKPRPMDIVSLGRVAWYVQDHLVLCPEDITVAELTAVLDTIEQDERAAAAITGGGGSRDRLKFSSFAEGAGFIPRPDLAEGVL